MPKFMVHTIDRKTKALEAKNYNQFEDNFIFYGDEEGGVVATFPAKHVAYIEVAGAVTDVKETGEAKFS